jgi:hypothetical protein
LFAALADRSTSFSAASASALASNAEAFAFWAASTACADSATACSVFRLARRPSRFTISTSCAIVADSSSRARAMCWPESRN